MASGLAPARRSLHGRTPVIALLCSALAWIALWIAATAGGSQLYSSSMSVGPTVRSVGVFLAAWEVMVIAMMLPSSLPFLALFRVVTAGGRLASVRRIGVCAGYVLAWASIGCSTALAGETLYRTASVDVWLENHANLLAGVVLTLAGGFQFTTLKRRCVDICSHPAAFIMHRYRRGVGNSLALGFRFGLVCVGCCWALMACTVVLGGGSLLFMLVLAAVMFAERALGADDRLVKLIGLAGIALGAAVAASPAVAPALAENAREWVGMQSPAMYLHLPQQGMWWCHV